MWVIEVVYKVTHHNFSRIMSNTGDKTYFDMGKVFAQSHSPPFYSSSGLSNKIVHQTKDCCTFVPSAALYRLNSDELTCKHPASMQCIGCFHSNADRPWNKSGWFWVETTHWRVKEEDPDLTCVKRKHWPPQIKSNPTATSDGWVTFKHYCETIPTAADWACLCKQVPIWVGYTGEHSLICSWNSHGSHVKFSNNTIINGREYVIITKQITSKSLEPSRASYAVVKDLL